MMLDKKMALLAAGGLLLVFAAFFVKSWAEQKERIARAEETQRATAALVAAQEKVIAQAQADIKERDARAATEVQRFAELARALRTPQQAAAALPQLVNLPQAARIVPEKTAADPPANSASSAAAQAGDMIIPKLSVVPLVQQLAACKQNETLLTACQGDVKDERATAWAYQRQYDAAAESAKKWEQAARGGSRWHRAWRLLKPLGCAAGGAAAGSLFGQQAQQKAAGAALGAAAGGIGCALF